VNPVQIRPKLFKVDFCFQLDQRIPQGTELRGSVVKVKNPGWRRKLMSGALGWRSIAVLFQPSLGGGIFRGAHKEEGMTSKEARFIRYDGP
jgi:hypothetical protein